ncbi:sugar ABC transporter permease [Georgenia satyanarayanai]|uniref:carbohydrate ABC transporter permease n=1 Tax=Georgenia satyanarayanai TaxID=860221 RepID=UPI002040766E|nr:sugar ABC transporter permease [Georgenia satyanarayanai]MCM3660925.1 sugar ABC transporter permease [Georgenia satyanarayanai]
MTSTAPVRPAASAPAPEPPARPAPQPPRRTLRSRIFRWEAVTAPYVYVAPFFLLFAAFGLFPLVYTVWVSLYDFRLNSEMTWVGLDNFVWLFENPKFYNALLKTFTIGVLSTVPQLVLALGLAHLLNYRMRARNFFRIAMIMPYATSVAASTLVFAQIFGRDGGFANWMLSLVGMEAIDWRNGNLTAQIAIAVIVTWRWTGYNALIYLAGMQSIPFDLYEAASLDGASRWQQFRHITLPGLRPTIVFTVVVSTIGATQLFGEPLLFGGGTPNGGAVNQYQTLGLFMYQQGWQFGSLGRAAAVAWVTFLLIIVLVLLNTALVRLRTRQRLTDGGDR